MSYVLTLIDPRCTNKHIVLHVLTLDRPKPNILTLYLALIYVLILTQLGGEVSTSEVSTQTAVWLRVLAWSEYVQFRPTWREYVKFKCQV